MAPETAVPPLQEPSPGGPSLMRTKRGALGSTVQTHLRTKARVCVCVCVLWGQAWGSACEGP